MSFAANPIGSVVSPCGFRSFLCRFELATIRFQTPAGVFGSFLYGIESFPRRMKSFPCGNESFPHGNDLQQLREESIEWSDTRFSHVELTRSHMEMGHSYIRMSSSDVASSRRRFASMFPPLTSGFDDWLDNGNIRLHEIPLLLHAGRICLGGGPKFLYAGLFQSRSRFRRLHITASWIRHHPSEKGSGVDQRTDEHPMVRRGSLTSFASRSDSETRNRANTNLNRTGSM